MVNPQSSSMDNLNLLPLNSDENKEFVVLMEAEIETDEMEDIEDGEE